MPRKAKAVIAKGQGEKAGKAKATAGAVNRRSAMKSAVSTEPDGSHKQGNPGRTPEDDLDDRIEEAECLLAKGLRKSEIKRQLMEKYSVRARTVENYLARARERMLTKLGMAKEEHRAGALAFYQSVIASEEATVTERLRAQQLSCWLLGLNSPVKVAPTNANGDDLSVDQAKAIISSLASTLAERGGTEAAGAFDEGDRPAD